MGREAGVKMHKNYPYVALKRKAVMGWYSSTTRRMSQGFGNSVHSDLPFGYINVTLRLLRLREYLKWS